MVANLNSSQLVGKTWASPDAIGTGTPAAVTCTALTATGNCQLGDAAGDVIDFLGSTVGVPNVTASLLQAGKFFVGLDGTGNMIKRTRTNVAADLAGTGLSASGGQLSVSSASAPAGVGDENATLTEAFNYATATITGTKTWTLPPSGDMSAGDTVYVKAAVVTGVLKIAANTSQTIDGLAELQITEDYASISLKYVAANTWRIF